MVEFLAITLPQIHELICPMLRDGCPACLSVTLVYCGQTVGWIKMPLGTDVGLGPGDIVLDGDPALPIDRGTAIPHFSTHCALTRSPISAAAELFLKHVALLRVAAISLLQH